jgi:hypothetical protein
MTMKKIIGRRKFFIGAGLSAAAITLLIKSPVRIFKSSTSKPVKGNITLKLNPSAVMRNKRA